MRGLDQGQSSMVLSTKVISFLLPSICTQHLDAPDAQGAQRFHNSSQKSPSTVLNCLVIAGMQRIPSRDLPTFSPQ